MPLERRRLLGTLLLGPLALSLRRASSAEAAAPLDPASPEARAVAYVEDGAPAAPRAAGNRCANCALYTGTAGSAAGGCQLFPGRQVKSSGWCSSWAPQM